MARIDRSKKLSIFETVKTFIKAVPFGGGKWRSVIVELTQHGGREFIHLRTFNRHRSKLVWYPTRRFSTIPIENAPALAEALCAAAAGIEGEKPEWPVKRDQGVDEPWEHPDEKVA